MKIGKVEKLVVNLKGNKREYVIHIQNLKQALNQGLVSINSWSEQIQSKSLAKTIH